MESWRSVWRDGFAPELSTSGLKALRDALIADDPRVIQGATTSPPPLECVQELPVEACCVLGYCAWQGDEMVTVAETEEEFALLCQEADRRLGEPCACRYFLNWYDEVPRDEMRRQMLVEVNRTLDERIGTDLFAIHDNMAAA